MRIAAALRVSVALVGFALTACGAEQRGPERLPAPTFSPVTTAAPAAPPPTASVAEAPSGEPRPLSEHALALRTKGITLLDQGRWDEAERVLGELLALDPANVTNASLHEAALIQLRKSQMDAAIDLASKRPIHLARPAFDYALASSAPVTPAPAAKLTKMSEKKNAIVDSANWLATNALALPKLDTTREHPGIPTSYGTNALVSGIAHPDHTILFYGLQRGFEAQFIVVADKKGKVRSILDFTEYMSSPSDVASEATFIRQVPEWAEMKDGVLFISTGHRTYAKSSGGKNAYVTAMDANTGNVFWRSQPLVCNAANFVLHGGSIICGYGFTAEPDFLYVLDQATGKVTNKIPVASGPEMIIERNGLLFVRTYDTDYVFSVQ